MAAQPNLVHSVDKAMILIELLLARHRPMSLQELSVAAGYPKSTTHALLVTLRHHDMVTQDEQGRYMLGVRLFECGCAVSAAWDISKVAHPHLEQLANETGFSAFIAMLDGNSALSFDQCASGTGLQVVPEVGSRLPLHATSQGKLFLSHLSDSDLLQRVRTAGMQAYTPHTITDENKLLAAVGEIRQQGYSVEDGEYKVGLRSVAASIYDRFGQPKYALGVVGLFRRAHSEEFTQVLYHLQRKASLLSHAIGGR